VSVPLDSVPFRLRGEGGGEQSCTISFFYIFFVSSPVKRQQNLLQGNRGFESGKKKTELEMKENRVDVCEI
jgi:hypothetical protein